MQGSMQVYPCHARERPVRKPLAMQREEGMYECGHRVVPVKAAPRTAFVLIES